MPSVGGVVDDDDFLVRILLGQHRFQASLDEAAAVVSNYRDGDEVVVRHEQEPEKRIINIYVCSPYPGKSNFVEPLGPKN